VTFSPLAWRAHRFGLSPERWAALAGRTTLVTGAGSGLGAAVATALAAAGANVILCGRRADRLEATCAALPSLAIDASRALALPLDVRDPDHVDTVDAEAARRAGPIGGVVHAAALPPPPVGPWPLADATPADWADQMATNLTGPWLVSRAVLRLARAPSLRIVFLSSGAGWGFAPGFGPYNVSKAAVNSLSASLAAECAARHPDADIQINAVEPGIFRSEMNPNATQSPYEVVPVLLLLLSHPAGGPTGRFFQTTGNSLPFGIAAPWTAPLG
jgi:3-oxoacyl-[acyl-carrier protein] reductase